MRPKLITPQKIILALLALTTFVSLVVWLQGGGTLSFIDAVPSTAGKLVYVSDTPTGSDIVIADGTAGHSALLTATGAHADGEPAWARGGDKLALTSNRNGAVRQLYLAPAKPGAAVTVLTNSSSTKEAPQFDHDGNVFFLDGGRVSKLAPNSADMDAVFPTAEQKRASSVLADLFASGGVTGYAVSPDGSRVFVAAKQENGEALLMYDHDGTVAAFGAAQKIGIRSLGDKGFAVFFASGQPLPTPVVIVSAETKAAPVDADADAARLANLKILLARPSDANLLVQISPDLTVKSLTTTPFVPTGFAVSSDGTSACLTTDDEKYKGVFILPPAGGNPPSLSRVSASEPSFSPDGTKVAFVSGGDIFVAGTGGGAAPVNLTNGKGKNHTPVWSPAVGK